MSDYYYLPEDAQRQAESIEKQLNEVGEERERLAQKEQELLEQLSDLVDDHLESDEEVPSSAD